MWLFLLCALPWLLWVNFQQATGSCTRTSLDPKGIPVHHPPPTWDPGQLNICCSSLTPFSIHWLLLNTVSECQPNSVLCIFFPLSPPATTHSQCECSMFTKTDTSTSGSTLTEESYIVPGGDGFIAFPVATFHSSKSQKVLFLGWGREILSRYKAKPNLTRSSLSIEQNNTCWNVLENSTSEQHIAELQWELSRWV